MRGVLPTPPMVPPPTGRHAPAHVIVELDVVDLKEAAAALAERATKTKMTGAEILRQAVGLEGTSLAGGLTIEGSGWASELLERAQAVKTEPVDEPEGFVGQLRSYQAEALGWLVVPATGALATSTASAPAREAAR